MNNFDSKEELYFSWWLNDLVEREIVKSYEHKPRTFTLSEQRQFFELKPVKQRKGTEEMLIKNIPHTLLQPCTYTPDFLINWNFDTFVGVDHTRNLFIKSFPYVQQFEKKALFYAYATTLIPPTCHSYIDVKGDVSIRVAGNQTSTVVFPVKQKWAYQRYGIYINSIKVPSLFPKTFTPKRYLLTDITEKERKINFEVRTLNEFLKQDT